MRVCNQISRLTDQRRTKNSPRAENMSLSVPQRGQAVKCHSPIHQHDHFMRQERALRRPDGAINQPPLNPAEQHTRTHSHPIDPLYLPDGLSSSHSSLRAPGPPIFRAREKREAGTVQEPLIITQYKREKEPTGHTHTLQNTHTDKPWHSTLYTPPRKVTKHTCRLTACERQIESPPFITEPGRGCTLYWMGEVIFFFTWPRGKKTSFSSFAPPSKQLADSVTTDTDFHLQIKAWEAW